MSERADAGAAARLVGAWALERFTLALADGSMLEPLGQAPRGRLVYTACGFMSAHLMPASAHGDGVAASTLGWRRLDAGGATARRGIAGAEIAGRGGRLP